MRLRRVEGRALHVDVRQDAVQPYGLLIVAVVLVLRVLVVVFRRE